MHYKFSPSALNLFLECPRCFWLEKTKGIKRPRGIFPSLPGGMDLVIKKYFDQYRQQNKLPPEIDGKVEGLLFNDLNKLETWRSWKKTNLIYHDKINNTSLSGALDDCLVNGKYYIPLDYKTRGSKLTSDPRLYYQNQLDCYCLLLDSNGYPTNGIAYLLYYWPDEVHEDGIVKFHVEPIMIKTDIENAKNTVRLATNILKGSIPQASSKCEYCSLVSCLKKSGL